MIDTERLCKGCMNDNGGEKICPICGYDSSVDNAAQYLSVGTWLNSNRYLVGKVVEENGDSAVYIGWDNDNNTVVHITEYLPVGIARRSADRLTVTSNEKDGIAFTKGMEEFIKLHTALSKITAANCFLPVVDIFETNGTIYSVSATVSSIALKDFLIRNGGILKWEQVKPLFMPFLTTLNELHEVGIIHRGISLDTILVGRDGRLYLTGFCIKSARCANTEFAYKLSAGYCAPEQYDIEQESGPASDIYAVGAVLFRCLIGSTPPDAKERLASDKLSIPANAAETISKGALIAIANALKIDPQVRTNSAERFKKMIEAVTGVAVAEENGDAAAVQTKNQSGRKYAILSSLITAVCFVIVFAILMAIIGPDKKSGDDDQSDNQSNQSSSSPYQYDEENIVLDDNGIAVPDWVGMTYSDAILDRESKNLPLEIVIMRKEYSDEHPKGTIMYQAVKGEDKKVAANSEIGVVISLGKPMIEMPDVLGKTPEEAKYILAEAGFEIGKREDLEDGSYRCGNIIFRKRTVANAVAGTINSITRSGVATNVGELIHLDETIVLNYTPEDADAGIGDSSSDDSNPNVSGPDGTGSGTSSLT